LGVLRFFSIFWGVKVEYKKKKSANLLGVLALSFIGVGVSMKPKGRWMPQSIYLPIGLF